ncbi:MAG TPA: L-glutamate gamma-semialdehyde dehydrogenase [Acidobacteriota bacterium]|nr:L-glutamate gamma-semialdehyde dehydrogenase [Acidobacteriota bacterium]
MLTEFKNEPVLDFSQDANRKRQFEALELVQNKLGEEFDLIIGKEHLKSPKTFRSINPGRKSQVIGVFQSADAGQATRAVESAAVAYEYWKKIPAPERANVLFRSANLLRKRRFECNAWMIFEVGKSWAEADADTAEAIDFCEFYGREALRYAAPQPLTRFPGEDNELQYIPLGVGAIIPPWNFPCAIMAGMTTAAIVAGNTVILKPSSDAPAIAAFFMEILQEAGLPPGVVNFVTGSGASVGNTIVEHPMVRFVAFTGSKEVGLHITEEAARPRPGQIWIKRVIAEMGGKDFIIVDEDADLDAAVGGVVASAYGFQGQKCSACSRAIIHDRVYPAFLERLIEKVKGLKVGPTTDPSNYMGPVINEKAMKSILEYIEIGSKEGKLLAGGEAAEGDGFYIKPTVIADVPPKARIAQEEIFGPVLAVIKTKDLGEAIRIANDSEYGLTGSYYGRNREKIARVKEECHVGNLYVNRKCTGALVGVHPFGGFNMSGTDSKAGGRDYLLLFTQAKAISEVL